MRREQFLQGSKAGDLRAGQHTCKKWTAQDYAEPDSLKRNGFLALGSGSVDEFGSRTVALRKQELGPEVGAIGAAAELPFRMACACSAQFRRVRVAVIGASRWKENQV